MNTPGYETYRPWYVVTEQGGSFHSGHDDEQAAQTRAQTANDNAAQMGITTRYKVVPNPS